MWVLCPICRVRADLLKARPKPVWKCSKCRACLNRNNFGVVEFALDIRKSPLYQKRIGRKPQQQPDPIFSYAEPVEQTRRRWWYLLCC